MLSPNINKARNLKKLSVILIIFGLSTPAFSGDMYRWVDREGTVHYSDEQPEGIKDHQTIKVQKPSPQDDISPGGKTASDKKRKSPGSSDRKSDTLRKIENFTIVQQERKWCALASMEMIARYYGYNIDQMQISIESDTPIERGMTLSAILKYLDRLKILMLNVAHRHGGDIEEIKRYIDNNIPVIWLHYAPAGRGWSPHVAVVIGYDDTARRMVIAEPSCGCEMMLPYREFLRWWQKTDNLMVIVTSRL